MHEAIKTRSHSDIVLKQGGIQQLNLLLPINQGQWGVTAAEEEEENKRIREFQDSIPKMCSQLRILTHFYQVSKCEACVVSWDQCFRPEDWGCAALGMEFLGGGALVLGSPQGSRAAGMREPRWEIGTGDL